MSRSPTADEVRHSTMLVTLVIVNVSGENYDAIRSVSLARLEYFRHRLLCCPSGMAATEHFRVG